MSALSNRIENLRTFAGTLDQFATKMAARSEAHGRQYGEPATQAAQLARQAAETYMADGRTRLENAGWQIEQKMDAILQSNRGLPQF